jgi:hypothetical protein
MQQGDARQADPEPAFRHLARVEERLAFELHTPSAAKLAASIDGIKPV